VQEKAVTFPTDAKLIHRARERLVRLAKKKGVRLRQSYARVGKIALIQHQRYAHAKQFKRATKALRRLRTILGRVIVNAVCMVPKSAGVKIPRCGLGGSGGVLTISEVLGWATTTAR
jgi:IS5 family transposase